MVILGALYGFMVAASVSWWWFEGAHLRLVSLAAAGFVLAAGIEYRALYLGKWSYAESMPVVPILELGVSPLLQMMVGPVMLALMSRRRTYHMKGVER